jgi:hypothetical protein
MSESFFQDCLEHTQFAKKVAQRHPRTILRWMNEPNGLPFTQLGNRKIIHLPTAREWLLSRMRRPNPERRRRCKSVSPLQHGSAAGGPRATSSHTPSSQ